MEHHTIDTVVTVPEDRRVTLQLPQDVIPGPHRFTILIEEGQPSENPKKSILEKFPIIFGGTWPEDLSLRREDMYGDDGR